MAAIQSSKYSSLVAVVLSWAGSALFFSLLYWGLWYGRPDSFILNKEFNLTPYQELTSRLWSDAGATLWTMPPTMIPSSTPDLERLMSSVAELDRAATAAIKELEPLRIEQERIESELKTVAKRHSELMWANADRYTVDALATEVREAREAAKTVEALEAQFEAAPSPHQAVVVADARVALAQAKYKEAIKAAEIGEYVLKNLGAFADPMAVVAFTSLEESLQENTRDQTELIYRLHDLRSHAYSNLQEWYTARQPRLEWVDFLYFSVGVSTTTTFGDIVPNSRTARIAVICQLVVSVLIVGFLINLIGQRKGNAL